MNLLIDHKCNKIIVSGVSSSGKSSYTEQYSQKFGLKYLNFDRFCFYPEITKDTIQETFLELYSYVDNFISDGIPYKQIGNTMNSDIFIKWAEKNNIKIIWTICTDKDEWIYRVLSKPKTQYSIFNFYTYFCYFYYVYLKHFLHLNNIFYDTFNNDYIEIEELYKRIKWCLPFLEFIEIDKEFLKYHIDNQKYDKYYQDIEYLNFKGYSETYKSWDNIKNLISWKDKIVIELGCFHGAYEFQIEQLGAKKIIGLEKFPEILYTANLIKQILKSRVIFRQWEDGDNIPEGDITLCMNALHHFSNAEKTLQMINSPIVIFEINANQMDLVKKYFTIEQEITSHRENRRILLCKKCPI